MSGKTLCPWDCPHPKGNQPEENWRIARQAALCAGQNGCPRAASCGDQVLATFLASAQVQLQERLSA